MGRDKPFRNRIPTSSTSTPGPHTHAESDVTSLIADLATKVSGPASATSGNLPIFSGTTGKLIADSGLAAAAVATLTGSQVLTNKDLTSGTNTFPTLNQNTTGSAAKWTTGRTLAITGDLGYTSPSIDGTGNVTAAGTLATVNSNVGAFGSASSVATFTVDAKGRTTAAASTPIAIAGSQITSGLVPVAQLGTGTPSSGTYLTGAGTWVIGGAGVPPGVAYTFDASTTMANPGADTMRWNSANCVTTPVTQIAMSATGLFSTALGSYLASCAGGGITFSDLGGKQYVFNVSTVVNNTTWMLLNVTQVFADANPLTGYAEFVTISRAGPGAGDVTLVGVQTLTNKTLTSPTETSPTFTGTVTNNGVGVGAGFDTWQVACTANSTATSTTNVTITGMSQTISVPSSSAVYLVRIEPSWATAAGTSSVIELLVDGNAQAAQLLQNTAALESLSPSKTWRITGMTVASHTFTAQVRNTAAATTAIVAATHSVMTIERKA